MQYNMERLASRNPSMHIQQFQHTASNFAISTRLYCSKISNHTFGTIITISGVLILCPDTLLLRYVQDSDPWTVIFYRHLFFGLTMLAVGFSNMNPIESIERLKALGHLGIIAGIAQSISLTLFTVGIQNTAVANVLVINATNPVFAAIFSYFILSELIPIKTVIVILLCFGAILLVFSTEFGSQESSALTGNLCALGAAITLGLYFTLIRLASIRNPNISFVQCNMISGLLTAVTAIIIGQNLTNLSIREFGFICVQGLIVLPLSFGLLTIGPEYITAPEVSLYTLIETIIGPVIVFAGGFEAPPIYTVYGGIMLFVALTGHSLYSLREDYLANQKAAHTLESPDEEEEPAATVDV